MLEGVSVLNVEVTWILNVSLDTSISQFREMNKFYYKFVFPSWIIHGTIRRVNYSELNVACI